MNIERDKKIAEALDIRWVDEPASGEYFTRRMATKDNPDFSTFDGMGLILRKGPEREWWREFVESFCEEEDVIWEPLERVLYLLQDPNRLANELHTFLKRQDA